MAAQALTPATPSDSSPDPILAQASITAYAAVSRPLAEIEALRSKPGPATAVAQVVKTLRNSDPQTVAAVAALLQAIDRAGWEDGSFSEWGVVGCPRFVGRTVIYNTVWRFVGDPKYSINPHIIPNYSLHSPSGTASIALSMHGANFGVGGGPFNASEGLITALSVLADGRLPGLWLLLSENAPEPQPDEHGSPTNVVHVHAAALALQSNADGVGMLRLVREQVDHDPRSNSVKSLADFIANPTANKWKCTMDGLGQFELTIDGRRE